ncbi:hypothetical protein BJX62DRAFT_224876 [Aspergillus germanicus]
MASVISLPYYASDLPCPLPTENEIDEASDISLAYGGRRIVRVGPSFVVKFGEQVNILEGENMLFIRNNTNILKNYIVMEHIQGETLLSAWPQLTPSEKDLITTTLRKPAINGPFKSEDELNEAFARKYVYDGQTSFRAEFYRQCLPRLLRGNRPTFTHGDFQRKNIIIQSKADGATQDDHSEMRVILLDWEKSGRLPSYWEYCLAVSLDPFISESAWFQALRLELWS